MGGDVDGAKTGVLHLVMCMFMKKLVYVKYESSVSNYGYTQYRCSAQILYAVHIHTQINLCIYSICIHIYVYIHNYTHVNIYVTSRKEGMFRRSL